MVETANQVKTAKAITGKNADTRSFPRRPLNQADMNKTFRRGGNLWRPLCIFGIRLQILNRGVSFITTMHCFIIYD
ncbi:hypothetical protein D3C87_1561550 [compost metagenome]